MKTQEFDYDLPEALIAQYPPEERGTARLLVLDKPMGRIVHRKYSDIPIFVNKGDVIVLNRTRVLKARVYATVKRTGRKVEVLFLNPIDEAEKKDIWYCLIGRARYVKIGDTLTVGEHEMTVVERKPGEKGFRIKVPEAYDLMEKQGNVPLPPYISRKPETEDDRRYNTVFSDRPGSVAAPTASLNLTKSLIRRIEEAGGKIAYVDLHVGLGTFSPVGTEHIEEHRMHEEFMIISKETADSINSRTGRVWAFGTTVVRALETAAAGNAEVGRKADLAAKSELAGKAKPAGKAKLVPFTGETDLYIYPGYEFKIVDVLVTNFHVPRSSLLMLVSAFAGKEKIMSAYEAAKRENYRFLSYGDSMLIGSFFR
jgi:S-adenosylmethionine:tRNA ribosyltransferase-isomerase